MRTLVKIIHGSHLFGTNTEKSDKDFKGVYLPTRRQLLLGSYPETIHENTNKTGLKNTKDDIDIEYLSLKKFLRMVQEGQTVALEILFAPDEFIIEKDPLWDEIRYQSEFLVCKNVKAFVGYCKTQYAKYGVKGSRVGALERVLDVFSGLNRYEKLRDNLDVLEELCKHDFISIVNLPADRKHPDITVPHFDVLGRKFVMQAEIGYVCNVLGDIYKNVGDRAMQAKENKGIDWKACSHAIRVMYQAIELMNTEVITLPLPEQAKQDVMKVKLGQMPFDEFQALIDTKMKELELAVANSHLPEKVDNDFIEDLICMIHKEIMFEND